MVLLGTLPESKVPEKKSRFRNSLLKHRMQMRQLDHTHNEACNGTCLCGCWLFFSCGWGLLKKINNKDRLIKISDIKSEDHLSRLNAKICAALTVVNKHKARSNAVI